MTIPAGIGPKVKAAARALRVVATTLRRLAERHAAEAAALRRLAAAAERAAERLLGRITRRAPRGRGARGARREGRGRDG